MMLDRDCALIAIANRVVVSKVDMATRPKVLTEQR